MNPKLFLTALCLLLSAGIGQAQQTNVGASQRNIKNLTKSVIRASWHGGSNLSVEASLQDPDIRSAWDVSEEQHQQMLGMLSRPLDEDPEYQKLMDELQAIGIHNNNDLQNANETTRQKGEDLASRLLVLTIKLRSDAINNTLTSEQKQKINESLLANMGEMLVSPQTFEVFNLTDVQKQQMKTIQKELEPAFEEFLEKLADGTAIFASKMFDEMQRQGRPDDVSAAWQQAIQRKLMEDPVNKKIYDELMSQNREFSTLFKTKMFDVLTDEQWARLQKLIDNPPEHAVLFRKHLKKQQGESEDTKKTEMWIPGPGAWQPGQGIPEGYRIERNRRSGFPRGENPSP